jgi:hypothetical protein
VLAGAESERAKCPLLGQLQGHELLKRRSGVREVLQQGQAAVRFRGEVLDDDAVMERTANGPELRQQPGRGERRFEPPAPANRHDQETQQEREGLVDDVVIRVRRQQGGEDERAQHRQPCARKAPACPVPPPRGKAVKAVEDSEE